MSMFIVRCVEPGWSARQIWGSQQCCEYGGEQRSAQIRVKVEDVAMTQVEELLVLVVHDPRLPRQPYALPWPREGWQHRLIHPNPCSALSAQPTFGILGLDLSTAYPSSVLEILALSSTSSLTRLHPRVQGHAPRKVQDNRNRVMWMDAEVTLRRHISLHCVRPDRGRPRGCFGRCRSHSSWACCWG